MSAKFDIWGKLLKRFLINMEYYVTVFGEWNTLHLCAYEILSQC